MRSAAQLYESAEQESLWAFFASLVPPVFLLRRQFSQLEGLGAGAPNGSAAEFSK